MCETVLKHMMDMYNNRLYLFKNENLVIFTAIMDNSSFRRCITDESVLTEDEKISIVYSGQVGIKVKNTEN